MKNFIIVSSLVFGAVFLSACGNIASRKDKLSYQNQGGQSYSTGTQTAADTSANECGITPNVTASGSWYNVISTQYRACAGSTTGSLKIFAEDETTKSICVFPATANGSQNTVFVADPTKPAQSRFLKSCLSAPSGIATASFSVSFNAVYIVPQEQADHFSFCLASGSLSACASSFSIHYSYGHF